MMKLKLSLVLAATAFLPAAFLSTPLLGQTASLHGLVNNPAGIPLNSGAVKLTTDKTAKFEDQKFKYSFDIDKDGNFKGTGIAPGDYLAIVVADNKSADFMEVTLKAGDDKVLNFDMSRKEYIDKMSPADKAALEEYKKKASETISANKVINNLNAALKTVRDDLASKSPNYDQDVKTMEQATQQKPDEAVLWFNLGQAQVAEADAAVKQDKIDKKTWQTDDAVTKLYTDGIASYKKGIDLNAASKKPSPVDAGIAWNSVGNSEAKLGKLPEAQEAFDNAVKLAPASAGMVYGNEAAVLFNAGQNDAAAAAADKAIAADPNRPDPYYIKGQYLIAKATVDSKTGKVVAPPGCAESYQKYLELAPDGPHAQDVKEILVSMGQTINTKYKAPGRK